MNRCFTLIASAALVIGWSSTGTAAFAQSQPSHAQHAPKPAAPSAARAQAMSSGEVKQIHRDSGKITIKHGPLANLGMPAMTMAFKVKDPAMLDQAKVGDKVNFVAEMSTVLTVTKLETVK